MSEETKEYDYIHVLPNKDGTYHQWDGIEYIHQIPIEEETDTLFALFSQLTGINTEDIFSIQLVISIDDLQTYIVITSENKELTRNIPKEECRVKLNDPEFIWEVRDEYTDDPHLDENGKAIPILIKGELDSN